MNKHMHKLREVLGVAALVAATAGVGVAATEGAVAAQSASLTGCVTYAANGYYNGAAYWYQIAECTGGTGQVMAWEDCPTPYGTARFYGRPVGAGQRSQAGGCANYSSSRGAIRI